MAALTALRSRLGQVGLGLAALVIVIALGGPLVAPYAPEVFIGAPFQPANSTMLLGADVLGRDVLSRVLTGGYRTLGLAAAATLLGVAAGAILGMAAGFFRGAADEAIMRLLDVALAFPQTIFALLFLSILGSDPWLIAVIVAAIHMPQVARVARAGTLRVASEDFVRHAEAIGMSPMRILLTEILPNISVPLLVELGLRYTYSIALIASLSFLGLGQQPPTPDWGLMINENRIGMGTNPWPVLVPVFLIAILTIGVNLVTDALSRSTVATGGGAAETPV
jgi:peptide/nickel transport system permease protein